MSITPLTFEADYVEKRSRATTFFRLLLAIPHWIVCAVWGFVAFFAVVIAWFALVVTGRWPRGLYDFTASFLRYATAVNGYAFLLTDAYPPFSGDVDGYPVRLGIGEPKPEYSRLKVLLRIFLMIPVYIIAYVMNIVASIGAFLAWFAIVVLGKQPHGLQDMTVLGLSYQQRAYAYMMLVTEDWPAFSNPTPALGAGPPSAGSLESPRPGFESPVAPESVGPTSVRPESVPDPFGRGGDEPPAGGGLTGGDPLGRP